MRIEKNENFDGTCNIDMTVRDETAYVGFIINVHEISKIGEMKCMTFRHYKYS